MLSSEIHKDKTYNYFAIFHTWYDNFQRVGNKVRTLINNSENNGTLITHLLKPTWEM